MSLPIVALIMAGGTGTRLWPLSRRAHPKQMMGLLGERSLYQLAVDRLMSTLVPEQILVITAADMADGLRKQSPEIPDKNFILEPEGRGTAPAIGLGSVFAEKLAGGEAMLVCLTADHFIREVERFRTAIHAAVQVGSGGGIVTLGIEPTYAATGYGYIHRGLLHSKLDGFSAFRVRSFKEKPDEETAFAMAQDGKHYWNSGMFIWSTRRVQEEFERQLPSTAQALDVLRTDLGTSKQVEALGRIWPNIPKGTIDYSIMEDARDVLVIPVDIGWSDVGSWASVLQVLPSESDGNVVLLGEHYGVDTVRTLVRSERMVATIGLRDMIVVDTPDVLLVCDADRAEEVRSIVQWLQEQGHTSLL